MSISTLADANIQSPSIPTADKGTGKSAPSRNVSFNRNSSKKRTSLSINSMLQQKQEQEDVAKEEETAGKPSDKFAYDDFLDKWSRFANKAKNSGKTNLFATLTKHKPVLKPNYIIELTIDNTVQEELIQSEKMELMDFLRQELNNYQINLRTILTKTEEGRALYTTRDKFERLVEKNPSLLKLKDNLNLDLDY